MANRSVFPNQIDTFVEHYDIQASDINNVKRWQELRLKSVLTPAEQTELQNLTMLLRNKMFTPEDFNKLQDCITNLEVFFRDNVQGFIETKQDEMEAFVEDKKSEVVDFVNEKKTDMTTFVNNKSAELTEFTNLKQVEIENTQSNSISIINNKVADFTNYVDGKVSSVNSTTTDGINQMESKKNYFINFVNTKEDEVRALVQEFDSNTTRYYTSWTATDGQIDFNIFNGSNTNIPPEANLNIPEEHIDLVINGVLMKPYTDYVIHNNGHYDTIRLAGDAQGLISAGTEVVAKWYKNVGKLYFRHASSHGVGGTDPLIVYEGMLDSNLKNKLDRISNKKITIGATPPESPSINDIWIDTSS